MAPSRGAGSTYKVFVAAAALARGYSIDVHADDARARTLPGLQGGRRPVPGRATPGSYRATLDLTTALYQSSNTYFVALEDALGSVEEPVHMAEKMGLYQFGPDGLAQQVIDEKRGSFTFGPDATSPLGLASAYSTLAAGGTQCDVDPVTAVLDPHGQPLTDADGRRWSRPATSCTPEAIPPGVANTLNQMLRKDVEPGNGGQTASRAYVRGHQIAGKTGTTQENVSVAFVGYTPEITASVMVFNPKVEENVGGFGGGKGATVWHDAMAPILEARGSSDFPPADPKVVNGNTKPRARLLGGEPVPQRAERGRLPDRDGRGSTATRTDGELVGTSPPRGGRAVLGQLVTILVSNGSDYTEPTPEPPLARARCPPPSRRRDPPVSPGTPGPGTPGRARPTARLPGRRAPARPAERRAAGGSSSACVNNQPTTTTRCSRKSQKPTATTPPTTVRPPKGAPRSSGRDRNSTKPCRNPERHAAVNSAPPASAVHRTRPEPTTRKPQASGIARAARTRVEADGDPAERGRRRRRSRRGRPSPRTRQQQRVEQHRGDQQERQGGQPAAPAPSAPRAVR